jgi:hypothetical protein
MTTAEKISAANRMLELADNYAAGHQKPQALEAREIATQLAIVALAETAAVLADRDVPEVYPDALLTAAEHALLFLQRCSEGQYKCPPNLHSTIDMLEEALKEAGHVK